MLCGAPIAHLVEHKIGHHWVGSLTPALGTGRNEPPAHPAENGYLAYGQGWDHGSLSRDYNGSGLILPREYCQHLVLRYI